MSLAHATPVGGGHGSRPPIEANGLADQILLLSPVARTHQRDGQRLRGKHFYKAIQRKRLRPLHHTADFYCVCIPIQPRHRACQHGNNLVSLGRHLGRQTCMRVYLQSKGDLLQAVSLLLHINQPNRRSMQLGCHPALLSVHDFNLHHLQCANSSPLPPCSSHVQRRRGAAP